MFGDAKGGPAAVQSMYQYGKKGGGGVKGQRRDPFIAGKGPSQRHMPQPVGPLFDLSQYPPLPLSQPVVSRSKGKGMDKGGKGKGKDVWQGVNRSAAGTGHTSMPLDESAKKRQEAEQQLAVAKQEVSFYRSLESKGLLAAGSRQMQDAQERLRRAKLHELGQKTLPEQARALQDRLRTMDQRLQAQTDEATAIEEQMRQLQERHSELAQMHTQLSEEREEAQRQLGFVQQSAAKEVPPNAWRKVSRNPAPVEELFLEFQDRLNELLPSDIPSAQSHVLDESFTQLYKTSMAVRSPLDGLGKDRSNEADPDKRPRNLHPGELAKDLLSGPQYFDMHAADREDGARSQLQDSRMGNEHGSNDDEDDLPSLGGEEEPFLEGHGGPPYDEPDGALGAEVDDDPDDDQDDARSRHSRRSVRSVRSSQTQHSKASKPQGRSKYISVRRAEGYVKTMAANFDVFRGKGPRPKAAAQDRVPPKAAPQCK